MTSFDVAAVSLFILSIIPGLLGSKIIATRLVLGSVSFKSSKVFSSVQPGGIATRLSKPATKASTSGLSRYCNNDGDRPRYLLSRLRRRRVHRCRLLLRLRGERPCRRRAAEQRDEVAPFHVWM